jgi:hypothetical protein
MGFLRAAAVVFLAALAVSPAVRGEMGRSASPRLILHDWHGKSPASTPSFVRDHLEFLETQPFDGLALYLRSPDLSLNVTTSVMSREPLAYEKIAEVLKPVAGLPFKTLGHNFAAVLTLRTPDLFDDWSVVLQNFGFLARASREAGLKGIYFDNENYEVRWADYPTGVAHPRKTLAEYQAQARLRGKQVMRALTAAHPDITVLTLHGPYISEPKAPSPLFPSWHLSNRLLGPFFAGFVEGAGDGATVVDGGELYHLRTADEFRRSHDWRKNALASDQVDCAYLPKAVRARWADRVEIAFGLYDRPFGGREMDPAILKRILAHALRQADRYVWLYVEGPTFLRPPAEGGADADWVGAVRQGREEVLRKSSR